MHDAIPVNCNMTLNGIENVPTNTHSKQLPIIAHIGGIAIHMVDELIVMFHSSTV